MTVGTSLVIILAGLLIAAFLHSGIGMLVAIIGVVALAVSLLSGTRARGARI
jgi:hypothetical protein